MKNIYLTATLRADASSKLPSSDRWGQFFSAALAWNFYDDGVDKLKLRVGFGEVGNVNGLGDYNFLTRYVSSDSQAKVWIRKLILFYIQTCSNQ